MTTDLDPPLLPSEEPPEILLAPEHRDRSAGLMAFGIVQILLGVLCVLMVGLMSAGQVMAAQNTGGSPNFRMMAFSLAFYVALAVILVWLGFGSIRARRWARALSLVLAWSWLFTGVITIVLFAFIMPKMIQAMAGANQGPPPAVRIMIVLIPLAILGLFFVVVPGSMVLFFRSKHVRATCESRDPVPRWTDGCPLPILAASLWLGCGSLSMLFMPWAYHGVMPFFGILLSGLPGSAMLLAVAGLWGYAAWAFYRLQSAGWWVVFVTLLLAGVSSVLTLLQVDFKEMYRLMGVPEDQIQMISQFPMFQGPAFVIWMGAFIALMLGYLIYVKRFFRRPI